MISKFFILENKFREWKIF